MFEPEEMDATNKELMMYVVKVHPEQETQGLAVTYCTNTRHLATVIENESLYYP